MDQNTESRDLIDLNKYYKREERGIDSVINIATNSSSDDKNSTRDKAESIVSMPENKFHSIEHTPELIPRRKKAKIRSTKVLSEKYQLTGKSLEIFEVLTNAKKKQKVSRET